MIQNKSGLPRYVQIAESLQEQILSAGLVPGQRLPAERELSRQLGVTRTTLRQALELLEAQGLLLRRQGAGTYVANLKIERSLPRLTPVRHILYRRSSQTAVKLIRSRFQPVSSVVAKRLEMRESASVCVCHRLHLIRQEAIQLDALFLPAALFPQFDRCLEDTECLQEIMSTQYGVKLTQTHHSLEAINATEFEADLLHISMGAPLFLEHHISQDQNGRPVIYVKSWYRGDRFRFVPAVG